MCITFSPFTIEKMKVMDVSRYVYEDDISIVMPFPKTEYKGVRALLAPFEAEVFI